MKKHSSMDTCRTVTVEKLVVGGYGLARLTDGKVVFIPHTLPGELVSIRPKIQKRDYIYASPVKIINPSPHRVTPPCPVYGRCGGCDLQHVDYAGQIVLKAGILQDQLRRSGVLQDRETNALWQDPIDAIRPFGYRQRLRLHVDRNNGAIGFFRFLSHVVEPIDSCLLAGPEINAVLKTMKKNPDLAALTDNLLTVELLADPGNKDVIVLLTMSRKPRPNDLRHIDGLAGIPMIKAVFVDGPGLCRLGPFKTETGADRGEDEKKPPLLQTVIDEKIAGKRLALTMEPGAFCQVNHDQNLRMIHTVTAWVREKGIERVLDLFCGMGNFALPLAIAVREVYGVDLQRAAIRSAKRNAELNGLKNCRFIQAAAEAGAEMLALQNEKFEAVILDPPRQGCAAVIRFLPTLGARFIVYISCDPATMGRDLASLALLGYRLKRLQMIDMFPQTHHIETMALLER